MRLKLKRFYLNFFYRYKKWYI